MGSGGGTICGMARFLDEWAILLPGSADNWDFNIQNQGNNRRLAMFL